MLSISHSHITFSFSSIVTRITRLVDLWYFLLYVPVCLREDFLDMDGELRADHVREWEEGTSDIHGIVDVSVPQLKHDAPPLLLVPGRPQPSAAEHLGTKPHINIY
jgi:hypothetical protein